MPSPPLWCAILHLHANGLHGHGRMLNCFQSTPPPLCSSSDMHVLWPRQVHPLGAAYDISGIVAYVSASADNLV